MRELELCHWLLQEPSGNCRSVFAPVADSFDGFNRVGAMASSPQFVFPLCFALASSAPSSAADLQVERIRLKFSLLRDDGQNSSLAFVGMDALKVATLVSELSNAMAQWVEAVGNQFQSIKIDEAKSGVIELSFCLKDTGPFALSRTLALTKAGIEMMAYARGLKVDGWLSNY